MDIDAHRRTHLATIPVLSLLMAGQLSAQATYDTLVVGDTIYINNCRYSNGMIYADDAADSVVGRHTVMTDPSAHDIIVGDTLETVSGCDSIVGIEVVRFPYVPVAIDATADCHIKQYRLVGHADAPFIRWKSDHPDPALEGHYTDSVLTLAPQQTTTYTLVSDFAVSELCPSSGSITLSPVSFPTASLHLKPEYLTLDNMEYDAYDIGPADQTRSWMVHEYLDGNIVAVSTPPPDKHIRCQASTVVDSLQVTLAVSNGFCNDTATASLQLLRATIWAPNVFTPCLESNNRFQILTTGLHATELNIYNRQGVLMFHATDLEQQWDGTSGGSCCQQGAYTWCLEYKADDFPDKTQKAVGTVLLLR